MSFFINIYAFFATIPFISFFIIYIGILLLSKSKKLAFNLSIFMTIILLYSSITSLIKIIFGFQSGFWFGLFWVIITLVTLGVLQYKLKGFIHLKKILFSTFRLTFILFTFFYVVLFFIGYVTTA